MKRLERSAGHQCPEHDVYLQLYEGRRCFKICCQALVLCRRNMTRGRVALPSLKSNYTRASLRKQNQLYFSCWHIVHNIVRKENLAAHPLLFLCSCSFQHSGGLVTPAAFPVSLPAAVIAQKEHLSGSYSPQDSQDVAEQGSTAGTTSTISNAARVGAARSSPKVYCKFFFFCRSYCKCNPSIGNLQLLYIAFTPPREHGLLENHVSSGVIY